MNRFRPDGPAPFLENAGLGELDTVQGLAREIWREVYPGMISPAQIEYMLERMYALEVMRKEITDEAIEYFLIRTGDGAEPEGFAALGPGNQPGEVILHKLYLRPAFHGLGHGTRALRELQEVARSIGSAKTMVLRVNRENHRAIRAYSRNGFEIDGEICSDIGDGFVMDDFWMRKSLV